MLTPDIEPEVDETGHAEVAGKMFLLRRVEMFGLLDDMELRQVAELLKTSVYAEGDIIIKQGDIDQDVYIVKSGSVKVHCGEKQLALLGPGEVFGELAVIDPAPRSATVAAAEPCCMYRLTGESFLALLEERPEIVEGVIAVLCRRLRQQLGKSFVGSAP